MKKIFSYLRNKHALLFKGICITGCVILIAFFLPKQGKFKYEINNLKGRPWPYEDFISPLNFVILKSGKELKREQEQAVSMIYPYFKVDQDVYDDNLRKVEYRIDREFKPSQGLKGVDDHKEVARTLLKEIYTKGILQFDEVIENKQPESIINVIDKNWTNERKIGDFYSIKQADEAISIRLNKYPEIDVEFMSLVLEDAIYPNILYDEQFTFEMREERLNNISLNKGVIQKGERIILKGDLVDEEKYRILESLKVQYLKEIDSDANYNFIFFGQIILVASCVFVLIVFMTLFRKDTLADNTRLLFLLFLITLVVLATSLTSRYSNFNILVVPFCILPIIVRAFYDARLATFVHVITVLICGLLAPSGFVFVFLQIIAGIISIFSIANMRNRSQLFFSSAVIFISYCVTYFGVSIIQEGNFSDMDYSYFLVFAINALLTLFAYPLIYIFEKAFGFISDVSLLELSDTNSPILRELAAVAPGTFQHSLQVANLAEAAIHQVGGSSLLVRTGALYHDIGKMDNPMYFIENQVSGLNPHDELSFEESAAIIKRHIMQGIERAKKHKIPDQVIDFIRTHHGTTLLQYFYRSYIKKFPNELVNEDLFRYPGPIPFSKETAVLMMADSVEASSRSLKKADAETINQLVENIINEQIRQEQFINSNITFRDIHEIKKIFKKMLRNIYHSRIEYPK